MTFYLYPDITIGEILDSSNYKDYELFHYVYPRILELCSKTSPMPDTASLMYEHTLKNQKINSISEALQDFVSEIGVSIQEMKEESLKDAFLYFWAFSTLDEAFTYCAQHEDARKFSEREGLVYHVRSGRKISTTLNKLNELEDLSSYYYMKLVTKDHDSQMEFLTNKLKKMHQDRKKGGQIRQQKEAEKMQNVKQQVLSSYYDISYRKKHNLNGKRKPFASYFCIHYNSKLINDNPNTAQSDFLKESTVERWIKESLNEI